MNQTIDILFSANQHYSQLFLTAVKSLLQAADEPANIRLTVIDRGIAQHHIHLLESYVSNAGAGLDLVDGDPDSLRNIQGIPEAFFELPATGHYDRLLAPFLIEGPRVLYLDCDIFVQHDLSGLWGMDFDGHPVCAVQDQIIPTVDSDSGVVDWREHNFEPGQPYFNSGVMLMNLDQWRSRNLTNACSVSALLYINRFGNPPPLHDQYALNVVCYQDWKTIPKKWNSFAEMLYEKPDEAAIVHFAGAHKPFRRLTSPPSSSRYFVRIVKNLMHEDFTHAQETADCLARLHHHHARPETGQPSLRSPNNNPVTFADPVDLAACPDDGETVIIMPVMVKEDTSLRFRNFCFLVKHYLTTISHLVIVEQTSPGSEDRVGGFVAGLDHPGLHHLKLECNDPKIHKTSLINQGARYCFDTLKARYVWQVDADIYINTAAVINQLRILNSKNVPVVRPLLYFIRLHEYQSQDLKSWSQDNREYVPPTGSVSPYQIIDLFGPGTVIFSEEAFLQTGGMDESYVGWGWEDMDFGDRLSAFKTAHTLPVIGYHLHHEEDRLPHFDNFENYCRSHREQSSEEEIHHILVHTIFHNYLTKFCIISIGDAGEFSCLFETISGIDEVLFRESPFSVSSLPENKTLAPSLTGRVVYSLASESFRFAGFHWDAASVLIDPVSRQPVQAEQLVDLLITSGFQILLAAGVNRQHTVTQQCIERRLDLLIEKVCDRYQRPVDGIFRKITSDRFDAEPESAIKQCMAHLQLPFADQINPTADRV